MRTLFVHQDSSLTLQIIIVKNWEPQDLQWYITNPTKYSQIHTWPSHMLQQFLHKITNRKVIFSWFIRNGSSRSVWYVWYMWYVKMYVSVYYKVSCSTKRGTSDTTKLIYNCNGRISIRLTYLMLQEGARCFWVTTVKAFWRKVTLLKGTTLYLKYHFHDDPERYDIKPVFKCGILCRFDGKACWCEQSLHGTWGSCVRMTHYIGKATWQMANINLFWPLHLPDVKDDYYKWESQVLQWNHAG